MAGPMDDGSLMVWSICTRPMTVPIMPMAGASVPRAATTSAPVAWRSPR